MSALRLAPSALVAALACARADATRGVRGAAARVATLEALVPAAVVIAPKPQRWTPAVAEAWPEGSWRHAQGMSRR